MALPQVHTLSLSHTHSHTLRHLHNLLICEISTYCWGLSFLLCARMKSFPLGCSGFHPFTYGGMIQFNSLTTQSSRGRGRIIVPAPPQLEISSVSVSCRLAFAYIHIYKHTQYSLKRMQVPASAHTHTHTQTYKISKRGWEEARLPKNHGWDQQLRVFGDVLLQNTTADFMADQSETHKHTCSVLRHVDKWRFHIVTHRVLV